MAKPRSIYWIEYQRGPGWLPGQPATEQPLHDHQVYLQKLMDAKTLLFAGLFRDEAGGGIAVLDCADEAAAQRILQDDPAVQTGLLTATLRPWLMVFNASAGISPFDAEAVGQRASKV